MGTLSEPPATAVVIMAPRNNASFVGKATHSLQECVLPEARYAANVDG